MKMLHYQLLAMNKTFVKESSQDDDDLDADEMSVPAGQKNYITPEGFAVLQKELKTLLEGERPEVVEIVHWAASNGDRSENGDYIYGKRRLREIDRRVRFLIKRLEIAQIVNSSVHHGGEQVFFGATVTYVRENGQEQTVRIVGIDEAEPLRGDVSWISPIAQALIKSHVGDEVPVKTPSGIEMVEVLGVEYPKPV